MSQPNKQKQNKRMRTYSADSMALHLVVGILLIALGVLIFLAVAVNMSGDVFSGLRSVCHGLAGAMALLLPIVPIWGGVLVLMSTQRKPPMRAFWLVFAILMLLLTCANLLTFTGVPSMSLMDYYLTSGSGAGMDVFMGKAYAFGQNRHMGGGLFGMLLAWPLWTFLGAIFSAILCILGIVVLALMLGLGMAHLTLMGVFERFKQHRQARQSAEDQQQEKLRQEQLAWQQREYQRQQAQAQQAAQQPHPPQPQQPYGAQNYTPQYDQQQPYPPQQAYQQPPVYDYNAPMPGQQPQQQTPPPQQPADSYGFQPTEEELVGVKKRPLRERLRRKDNDAEPAAPRQRRKGIFDQPDPTPEDKPVRQRQTARSTRDTVAPSYPQPQQAYTESMQPVQQQYTAPVQPVQQQYTAPVQPVQQQYTAPAQPQQRSAWQNQIDARLAETAAPAQPASEKTGRTRRSASWEESDTSKRTATWREDKEPAAKPAVQKPKSSWSDDDLPPWEEPVAQPEKPIVPAATTPNGNWQPDLHIAPVKAGVETLGDEQTPEVYEVPYVYPDLDLLRLPDMQVGVSPEEDAIRSQRLEDTLASFKVTAKVRHVTHGPAISRFELELAAGIKVSKVTDLAQNIAMNMEVKSVRIEAPIPGKSLVGVEVPNRTISKVSLREIMESEPMRNATSPLVVALGKDIAGAPIICDLARMPHLLIAGATGSGKSVCINTMINSLLYRCSPKEVRMILVDPKVVELQCYNGIPHLLIPVVSDPHKAAGALAWAVQEMMDRYKKFQNKGVRAIDGYNAALEEGEEHMPRIVVIIDELADLMMTCKRDVEDHICRLAQLARAAGIHLVVATQRPSVDVITGLIKANIPSRIAFKVSSFIDSRTILDKMGAEQLLGYGDMLYQPTGEFTPIRIQGCFLSDGEVNDITDFIRQNSPAQYDPNVIDELERLTNGDEGGMPDMSEVTDPTGSGDGSLLAQCIEMAVRDGQVSTSLIQRRLKVGYARAGRLVDAMEERGIVSQKDGAKPRMCLISMEEFERMKAAGEIEE